MGRKKKINKGFPSNCKTGNLAWINDSPYCISKESPNSRKFDKIPCQTFACPNYINEAEKEELPTKELKIRELIKEGKSPEYIIVNVPCSRSHYFRILSKVETEKEARELQKIESIKDQRTEENSNSESEKAEPIKRENPTRTNPLGIDQREYEEKIRKIERESGIGVSYKQIEKEEEQLKSKPSYPFKLNFEGDPYEVIEEALLLRSKWSLRNNRELSEYIKNPSLPYNILLHLKPIEDMLWLDEASRLQLGTSSNRFYVEIATSYSYFFYGKYTFKELFKKLEIPLPDRLRYRANEIIVDKDQLKESNIFAYLIEKARKELNVAYVEEKWDKIKDLKIEEFPNVRPELKMEIAEMKLRLMSGRFESLIDHETCRLLSEKLKQLIRI